MKHPFLETLVLLFLTAGTGAAQQAEQLCGDCKNTGRVAHEHGEADLALEEGTVYCSVFMENDKEALGLDWIPCPRCLRPSAKAQAVEEFEKELAIRRAWLEERRKAVDEVVKCKIDHVETKHFVIAFDLPQIKVDKKVLYTHAAMHLYAQRMENLHRRILEDFGMTDADTNGVEHHLYIFETRKQAMAMAPLVCERPLSQGTKVSLLGPESHMVCWDDPEVITNDQDRHQLLVHAVSHHIHDAIKDRAYWIFVRYGWVYEGLAHYLEIRDFGPPIAWCTAEGGAFENWGSKTWEANVQKAVRGGKQPSFQEVIQKSAGALTPEEHQFAWSYIDYLMWLDPKKMFPALKLMTSTQPEFRDVLRQTYGMTIGQFVEGWTAFVLKEYSMKPRKGPYVRERR